MWKKATVDFDFYRRYRLIGPDAPYVGQVIVVRPEDSTMTVDVDTETLRVDFRHESTRADVPGRYRRRPGIHLADRLDDLAVQGAHAVLVNGNNIGYWANQFAVQGDNLLHKERGPIFDDGDLERHTGGAHPFFCWSAGEFGVQEILLEAVLIGDLDTVVAVIHDTCHTKPDAALSGLPVLREGEPVWQDNLNQAWDPRLVYEVGRLVGVTRHDTALLVRRLWAAAAPLARHPMTAMGVDRDGCAVVAVVEQSKRSPGISLAGMATLLQRFEVGDAVILGAAGDAQLATTEEGFLVAPLVTSYARAAARRIPDEWRHAELGKRPIYARPVPSTVTFTGRATGRPTAHAFGGPVR